MDTADLPFILFPAVHQPGFGCSRTLQQILGIVHTDFESQQRTVKDSGRFYADIIANQGVTEAAHARWVAGQTYPTNKEAR